MHVMKKMITALLITFLVIALAGCSKGPTLSGETAEDGKSMEISANKADPDDFFMTGSLEIEDCEALFYDHQLEKGTIEIQLIPGAEDQSIEELPDTEGKPAETLTLSGSGSDSLALEKGSYMTKVTVTGKDKAAGSVKLEVKPAD